MNIELRMYTWSMFFVTCSGVFAYEIFLYEKNKKTITLFILASLGAAYTHYYAALTECFVYLFLYISLLLKNKNNIKICFKLSIITIIGYIPWLPIFIKQSTTVKDGWWLQDFSIDNMLDFIKYIFNGEFTHLFIFLFSLIIVCIISYTKNNIEDKEILFSLSCIFSFLFTVILGCILSKLVRPLFINRYMYPGVGLLFLGIVIGLTKLDYSKLLREGIIALIVINFPFSYAVTYSQEYKNGTDKFKEFVHENINEQDTIYTDMSHMGWTILPYYCYNNIIDTNITSDIKGYYITTKEYDDIISEYPTKNIEYVYSGDIDNSQYFNIYLFK